MNSTSLPEMREWLRRIDYTPSDLNTLNMIHITGTKGKGSTCAFVSSILQELFPQKKVGLFTSPHLKAVNERIQVNSVPISEDLFARYFWEVWDRLENSAEKEGVDKAKKPVPAQQAPKAQPGQTVPITVTPEVGGKKQPSETVPAPVIPEPKKK